MKLVRAWKKVYLSDLDSLIYELKDCVDCPSVIILKGELGVGKTTFTGHFVNSISPDEKEVTTSPTYSLVNEVGPIVHADFYRLKNREELVHLELALYLEGKDYFLVEWGENYLYDIKEYIDDEFSYYQLSIETNSLKENEETPSRNFVLEEV